MSRRLSLLAAVVTVIVVLCGPTRDASAQFRFGPHPGLDFDTEQGFGGVDVWFGLYWFSDDVSLHANLGTSYFFIEKVTLIRFDVNFPFLFDLGTDIVQPYAAPGLMISYKSWTGESSWDVAANAIGGALFLTDGMVQPFVQFRLTIEEKIGAAIMGGVLFQL